MRSSARSAMVGVAGEDALSAVELLSKDGARKHMRKRKFAERKGIRRAIKNRGVKTFSAADDEDAITTGEAPSIEQMGQIRRIDHSSTRIESNDVIPGSKPGQDCVSLAPLDFGGIANTIGEGRKQEPGFQPHSIAFEQRHLRSGAVTTDGDDR